VRRIGHGGEATVFELTGGRALRVYHGRTHGAPDIAAFYRSISVTKTSFAMPRILEQGEEDGVAYSIDRLIPGRPLHELMPLLEGDERRRALASYTDAAFEIASLPCVRDEFGEFLRDHDSIRAESWSAYLDARMRRCLAEAPWLRDAVPVLDAIVDALTRRIDATAAVPKALVHGDYFPGNVLIGDDLNVSGVIDFGPLTVIGDPMLDLASAVIFLEVARPGYRIEDTQFVRDRLAARVGPAIDDAILTYRAWYAIRFSPYRDDDANLYAWCTGSLNKVNTSLGL
jgi:aminoglycoside phosphotransferase (APT) family kinase protein